MMGRRRQKAARKGQIMTDQNQTFTPAQIEAALGLPEGTYESMPEAAQVTLAQSAARVIQAESRAKAAESKAKSPAKISAKLQASGVVSVYGLGRFPVSLYAEQWDRLMAYTREAEFARLLSQAPRESAEAREARKAAAKLAQAQA
jgi:hypothetical protein